jgi:hypothetical protein
VVKGKIQHLRGIELSSPILTNAIEGKNYFEQYQKHQPIAVAARSKEWTVFSRSNTGIVGSNPTRGTDVLMYVYSAFGLSCV